MKKCIICGELKKENEFNIEHIIPEALGNKSLKIDNVCVNCNSKLGSKVDKYITTGFFMELVRMCNNVGGKNNKLPFPFKEGMDEEGNKIRLDNNFSPSFVPRVENNGNLYNIRTSTKQEAIEILQKICNRKVVNYSKMQEMIEKIENAEMKESKPTISYKFELDLNKLEVAILKVAYEYAYLKLGETYYSDKYGVMIRNIIKNAIDNNVYERCNFIFKLPNKCNSKINYLGKNCSNSHLLIMQPIKNEIILLISLFCEESLTYVIRISDNSYIYQNAYFTELIELNKI